jgi:hypothetical protein
MTEHPTREQLRDLVGDRLPMATARAVVAHLLLGCERCQAALAPLALPLFKPGRGVSVLGSARPEDYERPVAAAYSSVLALARRLEEERNAAPEQAAHLLARQAAGSGGSAARWGPWTYGLCEYLLEESLALRFAEPDRMVGLAELASAGVAQLSATLYGADRLADLAARVAGELANAYRVKGDLRRAETAMVEALSTARRGTGALPLKARLAEIAAILLGDQRRFDAAQRMLDVAYAIHRRARRRHETGLVLIRKGLLVGWAGDPARAILFLGSGLAALDRRRDPRLVFHTLHNVLYFKIQLGEYRVAAAQLWQMRPLYRRYGSLVDLLKLRGFEAHIAAGLGDTGRAERAFVETRQGFEDAGLVLDAALVGLDLASLWLRAGRAEEVGELVEELFAVFAERGVEREALAALSMLRDAVSRRRLTAELIAAARQVLERAHDPR